MEGKLSEYFKVPDLNELYSRPYGDEMREWREIGAMGKADDIAEMTKPIRGNINRVLEVGCGTGSVLRRVKAAGIGREFHGVEISDTRTASAESDGITLNSYDGARLPFDDGAFDLIYATHVLEHVTDERGFLRELGRVSARYVLVEVPCELTIRSSTHALQASLDCGHINAYTPESFILTLESSGLRVVKARAFCTSRAVNSYYGGRVRGAVKYAIRRAALATLGQIAASRFMVFHWCALCERA